MSSMMNGNMADNNPAMSYLMLNMFMENRKNTKVQSPTKKPSQITSKKTTARRKKNESAQAPTKKTSQLASKKTTADSTEDPAE